MSLDPHAARFLSMLAAGERGGVDAPVAERRAALEDLARLADRVDETVSTEDLWLGGAPVRLFRPMAAAAAAIGPGVLYLHGGGWTAGSLDTHAGVCSALAAASGFPVLSVDYRLAPEHPFPAGLHDAQAALLALYGESERLGVDRGRLILAGDSAGATLAAALARQMADQGRFKLARLLLLCPILDPRAESPSRQQFADGYFLSRSVVQADLAAYLAGAPADDERVSPLRAADLAGLPPTDIHVAAFDPFRDEGLAYAERLKAAGVEAAVTDHPGMIHYFYALSRAIPYGRRALAQIGGALKAAMEPAAI